MEKNEILYINAELKYIEYILGVFDTESETITLGEIRKKFKNGFRSEGKLANQYFGIVRMITLVFINEEGKKGLLEKEDIEKIKIIRNSVAHNDVMIDEKGYTFKNRRKGTEIKMSYDDMVRFVHKIENIFYKEDNVGGHCIVK